MKIAGMAINNQLQYDLSTKIDRGPTFNSVLEQQKDRITISNNAKTQQNYTINVTDLDQEQLDYLNNKYGDFVKSIESSSCYSSKTKELMRELKDMGLITENEFAKYDKPIFPLGVKIPAGMTDSNEIVALLNSKISTQPVQKTETNIIDLFRSFEKTEHSQPKLYGKIANILDELFNKTTQSV